MTVDTGAATPAPENEGTTPPILDKENQSVQPLDNEDVAARPEPETEGDDKDETSDRVEKPRHSRAERMEEIAKASRERERASLEETRAAMSQADAPEPEPEPIDPDSQVTLRVNRENVGVTARQRDELASEVYEGDLADLSERERNKYAQMAIADRRWQQEKRELQELREAHRQLQEHQPAPQQQTQTETPKEPEETPDEKRARAIEIIQLGGSREEANALLAEANRAEVAAMMAERDQQATERQQEAQMQRLNEAIDRDMAQGREAARKEFGDALADPVVESTVSAVTSKLHATIIGQTIKAQPAEVQQAFVESGITPARLQSMNAGEVDALYRDMAAKGYKLPPPGGAYKVAAKVVLERLNGSTQPTAGQNPGSEAPPNPALAVDRSGRKESISQPERATIPRQGSTQSPRPRTERERAQSAFREEQAARRRGAPVRK